MKFGLTVSAGSSAVNQLFRRARRRAACNTRCRKAPKRPIMPSTLSRIRRILAHYELFRGVAIMRTIRLLVGSLALVTGAWAAEASAAELKVLSAGAMRGVLQELGPAFETASGHKLKIE